MRVPLRKGRRGATSFAPSSIANSTCVTDAAVDDALAETAAELAERARRLSRGDPDVRLT